MARADLFFVNDLLDPAQHLEAHRQPGIDPRRLLLDHPRPQHQPMRGDLRLGGRFLQNRQKIAGQAHGCLTWLGFHIAGILSRAQAGGQEWRRGPQRLPVRSRRVTPA